MAACRDEVGEVARWAEGIEQVYRCVAGRFRPSGAGLPAGVKGGEKVYHCGGGIVYHRQDEKGLNWEPGGVRSGSGVRRSGVNQESSRSSETSWAALCRR